MWGLVFTIIYFWQIPINQPVYLDGTGRWILMPEKPSAEVKPHRVGWPWEGDIWTLDAGKSRVKDVFLGEIANDTWKLYKIVITKFPWERRTKRIQRKAAHSYSTVASRWWFQKMFLCSSLRIGEMIQFWRKVFQMGWNHKLLLMEEILHHLGCIKPCKYWDIYHINWCRISSINSSIASLKSH